MASCFPTKEKGDKKAKQGAVPNGDLYPQAGSPEETPKSEQPRTLETSKSKADLKREESENKKELKRQESVRKKQEKEEKKKSKASSSRSLSTSSSNASFTLPPGAIQLAPGQAPPPGYVIITPGQPLPTDTPAQTVAPGAPAPAQAVTHANASAPATVPVQADTTVVSTPAAAPSTFSGAAAPVDAAAAAVVPAAASAAVQEEAPRSMAKSASATSPPTHIPIAVDSPLASPIATSVTPLSTSTDPNNDADTPVVPRATSPDDVELSRPSGAVQTQSFPAVPAAPSSVPAEVGQQTATAVVISQLAPHGQSASTPVVPGIAAVLPAEPVSNKPSSDATVVNEASYNTDSVVAEPARAEGEKAPTSGEHPTEFEVTVSIKSDEPQLDIAGEFTNWERRPMIAETTEQGRVHKYYVSLPRDRALEKQRWMFKFVAGDRWFHDSAQPSWNDNGNENNYVSTEQFK